MLLVGIQRQLLIPAIVIEFKGAAANGSVIGKGGRIVDGSPDVFGQNVDLAKHREQESGIRLF